MSLRAKCLPAVVRVVALVVVAPPSWGAVLSPPAGALRLGAIVFHGLTPVATDYRPLGSSGNGVKLRCPRRCRGWPHDVRPTGRNVGCCLPRFGCDSIGPITDRGSRGRTTPTADGVRTAPTCDWQQCGDLWRRGRLPAEWRIGRRRGATTRRAQARRTCPKDRHCLPSECLNMEPFGLKGGSRPVRRKASGHVLNLVEK